ncbi:MAG: hydroxymethylglutaryl-CoA reductase, degradative [Spirochaetaceae bacterium]
MMSRSLLPQNFRKLDVRERHAALSRALGLHEEEFEDDASLLDLADVMVESAVGVMPIPLGVATGFLIDGERYDVPMATEEPSVVAAATYAARITARAGGISTEADPPVMTAQIFQRPESTMDELSDALEAETPRLEAVARGALERMETRGGGFRALRTEQIREAGVMKVEIDVDVRDAMGANLLNTVAEDVQHEITRRCGGTPIMGVLTNAAQQRRVRASFTLPVARLARGGLSGPEVADRIATASEVADADTGRAITHNKGVMNGITAVALATANDTRGLEAAAHAWAARSGTYRALSSFTVRGEELRGHLELPLVLATVGGAVGFHPYARRSLALLGDPGGSQLSRIAAAVGLAQNLAAIHALVSEGIQRGHMRLHAARVAYKAGARGAQMREIGRLLWEHGDLSEEAARALMRELDRKPPPENHNENRVRKEQGGGST